MDHGHLVHTDGASFPGLEAVFDKILGLDVQMGDVRCDGGFVERRGCALASALQRVVVGRGANGRSGGVRENLSSSGRGPVQCGCLGMPSLHRTVTTYLVKGPKNRPTAQRLAIPSEYLPGRIRAIHHHDWFVAQLYLIHISIDSAPLSVLFCRVILDIRYVTDNWPVSRAGEMFQAYRITLVFIKQNIERWEGEDGDDGCAECVLRDLMHEQRKDCGNHSHV